MKVIIYGIGRRYQRLKINIIRDDVIAICDRNIEELTGQEYETVSADEIRNLDYDYVVVTSSILFDEIVRDLIFKYGVNPSKIITLDEYLYLATGNDTFREVDWKGALADSRIFDVTAGFFDSKIDIESHREFYADNNLVNIRGALVEHEKSDKSFHNYVVTHKTYNRLDLDGYSTICVGTHKDHMMSGDCRDDLGDSISCHNSLVNECTALYWIWRNEGSDQIGLSHYRRYLSSCVNPGWPILGWEADRILKRYNIIVARHEHFGKLSVSEQLRETVCEEAYKNSFRNLLEIMSEIDSDDVLTFKKFLEGKFIFPCQMFIMPRNLLDEYCNWLFPIILTMIERVSINPNWDDYSKRIIGFWAERLLTVWLLKTGYRLFELPIILTEK